MTDQSKGYIQYNGTKPMYTLGSAWQPGVAVSLESLSVRLGDRCGDLECGEAFMKWIHEFVGRVSKFSIHLSTVQRVQETAAPINRVVVESGPISVSPSPELAAKNLQDRELGKQSAVSETEGVMIETTPKRVKTSRMFTSISEAKEQLEEFNNSGPMTGDMLDEVDPYERIGNSVVAAPPEPVVVGNPNYNTVEPIPTNTVVANPSPTLDVRSEKNVMTGSEGIVSSRVESPEDQTEAMANIQTVYSNTKVESPNGKESTVVTGDDLVSSVPEAAVHVQAEAQESSTSDGGTRPAMQGLARRREVTIDHIVRASGVQGAMDAVNECTNRNILKLAKTQLGNTGDTASNKIIKSIDRRIRFLKARGM